ncbi:MAG TPA: hypothetical protein VIS54_03345 [Psychromonas sp.]
MKEDFDKLVDKLKAERDTLKLKIHLGSMEAKAEFEEAEKKWHQVKMKASEISDDAVETSEEYISKAKVVGEELKEAYSRIAKRLKK